MNFGRLFGRRNQEPKPVPVPVPAPTPAKPEAFRAARAVEVVDFVSREVTAMIQPGITTREIERHVEEITRPTGANLYFKGYRGYPSILSLPVNDEVVHTPPSKRVLREGDLLKMEFGVGLNGRHAVVEWTFPVGQISAEDRAFLTTTHEALLAGLARIRTGARMGAVSFAIHQTLTAAGLSTNRDFVGYGIGERPVMPPQIPCFSHCTDQSQVSGPRLSKGMVLAILVIAHRGNPACFVASGQWGVRTKDGGRAVLFSRMVEVTDEGARILTKEPLLLLPGVADPS